jgi:hypothetical protein
MISEQWLWSRPWPNSRYWAGICLQGVRRIRQFQSRQPVCEYKAGAWRRRRKWWRWRQQDPEKFKHFFPLRTKEPDNESEHFNIYLIKESVCTCSRELINMNSHSDCTEVQK